MKTCCGPNNAESDDTGVGGPKLWKTLCLVFLSGVGGSYSDVKSNWAELCNILIDNNLY